MTFAVRERGAPGGPQHGIVTVDQRTASFIYTADPGFVGTDTFSVNVSDDTSLHVHGLAGYLGPFHGHDDVATVTVFVGNTPTDTISGDFSMLTYNIAGLPFPLSSAILPRFFYTKEIGKRLNAYYVANVQEDFAYHQFLIKKSKMPSQTPPEPPTLLWPIGVPFSDGLNTLSEFKVQRLDRQTWYECTSDNCLTLKGFTYSQMRLPGGDTVDVYNTYQHRWRADHQRQPRAGRQLHPAELGGPRGHRHRRLQRAVLRRPKRSVAICAGQRAHRCLGAGRTRPHHTAVRAHLHGRQRVRAARQDLLSKRPGSDVAGRQLRQRGAEILQFQG